MSLLAELLESHLQHSAAATPATPATPPPESSKSSDCSNGAGANRAFCVRWCEAALAAGVLPDVIERLPEAELEQYRQHFETCADWYAAAQAAAHMLQDSADMRAGHVPHGWTAAAVCHHCGPVWLHPAVASMLETRDGTPWCWGCPWCFIHLPPGHALPRPGAR